MSIKRKSLVRTLDKVFSDYIRARDHYRCVTCGSTKNIQAGHLFSRIAYSTRWDTRNCWASCSACNLRHEYDPGPLTMYFLERFGDAAYAELHRRHRIAVKYSDSMLQEMIDHFRTERAALMAEARYAL